MQWLEEPVTPMETEKQAVSTPSVKKVQPLEK